jgi:hypothetical protein
VVEERHRGDLTPTEIVAHLHSCLSGAQAFKINAPALILHRGNITLKKIRDFLSALGVDAPARRLLIMPLFVKWFAALDPPLMIEDFKDADLERLLAPIDDLVERRNLVAHGVIDDIETLDLLNERCQFVAVFSRALHELLQIEMLRVEITGRKAHALGRPIEIFDDHIVCFEVADCKISVGDRIVAVTEDALVPFRWSSVIRLELDRAAHQSLDITSSTKFAVQVGFSARKNHEYFVLTELLSS